MADETLEQLETKAELLDCFTTMIIVVNENLQVLYSNDIFQKFFPKEENLNKLMSKETKKDLIDKISKSTQKRQIMDIYFKNIDKWFKIEIVKIKNDRFALCGPDITEEIQRREDLTQRNEELQKIKTAVLNLLEDMSETQRSLRTANTKLKQLDILKNEFISIASHELRTPMTSIKGYLSMIIAGDAGPVPEEISDFLNEAYKSNEILVSLVNDMLDVSRMEQKKLTYEIKSVKALPIIKDVIKKMNPMAKESGNKMELKPQIDERLMIKADAKRFTQIVNNLVENAIKFTEKGTITVHVNKKNNFLQVAIQDTGIGISKKDLPKLFQKFYQIRAGLARPKGGTGLGLYITKKLVEGMGGNIWVKSQEAVGSTFTFTLPLASL